MLPLLGFQFSPFFWLSHPEELLWQPLTALGVGLWIWMLVHCARNDPERGTWMWILFFLNIPGAILYFIVRWLPTREKGSLPFMKRFTSGRHLARLEAAARRIGNPHQFVELGDLQRELGKVDAAWASYQKALSKDPGCMPALWGAAQAALARKQPADARPHLEAILAKDFAYKFGDVSLAQARTLHLLGDGPAALAQLQKHLGRWTHPEAHVLIATVLAEQGEVDQARDHLETMLSDLAASPAFFARQNRHWASRARGLLRTLPKA